MAITPSTELYDYDAVDPDTDEALIDTWLGTLTISDVYGFQVTKLGGSRVRVTLLFA